MPHKEIVEIIEFTDTNYNIQKKKHLDKLNVDIYFDFKIIARLKYYHIITILPSNNFE